MRLTCVADDNVFEKICVRHLENFISLSEKKLVTGVRQKLRDPCRPEQRKEQNVTVVRISNKRRNNAALVCVDCGSEMTQKSNC